MSDHEHEFYYYPDANEEGWRCGCGHQPGEPEGFSPELDRFLADTDSDLGVRMMHALPNDDPIMIAWREYRLSDEYANSLKWAAHEEHREGSLRAAFITGWQAADKNAIHEQRRDDE